MQTSLTFRECAARIVGLRAPHILLEVCMGSLYGAIEEDRRQLRSACRFLKIDKIPETYSKEAKAIIKKALAKGWDRYSL